MLVTTTPTIRIKRTLLDNYSSVKISFRNTSQSHKTKIIEVIPTPDQSDPTIFLVNFSESDTKVLDSGSNSYLDFEIYYKYSNGSSNIERSKLPIPIYSTFSTGNGTAAGGIDGNVQYETVAEQPNVEVPGTGTGENGATFIPSVEIKGNTATFSWENDQELPNPEPVTLTAPKGNDAIINGKNSINISAGPNINIIDTEEGIQISSASGSGTSSYAFSVRNGRLILSYTDGSSVPNFRINEKGRLIMTIEEAQNA